MDLDELLKLKCNETDGDLVRNLGAQSLSKVNAYFVHESGMETFSLDWIHRYGNERTIWLKSKGISRWNFRYMSVVSVLMKNYLI